MRRWILALLFLTSPALAHEPYTSKTDPVYMRDGTPWAQVQTYPYPSNEPDPYYGTTDPWSNHGCCGGSDCAPIPAELVSQVLDSNADGYILTLTLEQTRIFNPQSKAPIHALIPWKRVQPTTPDMKPGFHLCIHATDRSEPRFGVLCFFEPPNA